MNRHAGLWWQVLVVFVMLAVLMKIASCGLEKELKVLKKPHHARSGHTLIEMLCVMAIIGVVIAIAAVAYTSFARQSRFEREVSDMECAIALGRQYAVTKNEPVLVVFVEPGSFGLLNAGATARRCGWGIVAAKTRTGAKPVVDLQSAGLMSDSMWPKARNVVGLEDGGDWWMLCYTNIPRPWVEAADGFQTNKVVNLPGFALKSDGTLHREHGGIVDTSMAPKGVLLGKGTYVGSDQAGWTRVVTGAARRSVLVNWVGKVTVERVVE